MAKPADYANSHFKDRVDKSGDFRIVELKIPHERSQPGYGPFEYEGLAAYERLRRFCAGFLSGTGDLTVKEAEKIIRNSRQKDERRT